MNNPLIEKFGKEKVWVSWKLIERDGKKTKIPYQADNVTPASSTDPNTWSVYEDITSDMKGVVLPLNKSILFVDIDHCINNNQIEHEQKTQIENLLQEANTYTELSPSGTGLHLFLSIIEPEGLILQGNRKSPYELYTSGRYFTYTGNTFMGSTKEIRSVTIEEANKILSTIGYPFSKPKEEQIILPAKYTNLDDETILNKMFSSKNGVTIKSLYNGDSTEYANDKSRADSALLSHLAFWTGKDTLQMERIWTNSPLGQREKTVNRKDYRDRTITNAINSCRNIYEPPKKKESSEIEFLTITKKVKDDFIVLVIQNTENIARVLRQDPDFAGKLRYDKFRNTMEFCGDNDWSIQENAIAIKLQSLVSIKYQTEFAKVPKEMVSDAMILVSKENTFDSAIDFIREQVWDKVPRLDTWLSSTYGVEDNLYHKAVGSNWLKGLVKRLIEPGCKFDYVLVLEGEQGSKKSTSLAVLGGRWHVETSMGVDNKDFFMQFQGKSIIEFSEGETLSRTEVKKMKAIITTQYDKYRPPYERVSQDFPRRCVFAMTTNETEYLKDETGNRRWLPVKLVKEEADVEWLADNRNQLFAEAYHRLVVLKESVHDFPKEETKNEQAKRRILDPNTDTVVEWYMNNLTDNQREEGVTIMMAYEQVINKKGGGQIDRLNEMKIGTIFKETLQLEKRRVTKDGMSSSRYFYTGKLLVAPKDSLDINTW